MHPKVICCQLYAVEIESQQKICFYVKCKTLDMSFTEMEILTINSLRIIRNNRSTLTYQKSLRSVVDVATASERPFDLDVFKNIENDFSGY